MVKMNFIIWNIFEKHNVRFIWKGSRFGDYLYSNGKLF